MAQLNIRIDEAARAGLDAYAEARGMATGDLVRHLIDQAIKDPRAAGAEGYVDPYTSTRPATLTHLERRTLAMQHRILALLATRPTGGGAQTGEPLAPSAAGASASTQDPSQQGRGMYGLPVMDQWGELFNPTEIADGEVASHLRAAVALEQGYTGEYADLFVAMQPELSPQACDLVYDILTMFRVLAHAWSQLAPDEQQALERSQPVAGDLLHFRGFDTQDPVESRLLGYVRFLVTSGLYPEVRGALDAAHDHGNSHSRRLPFYLQLLEAYRPRWQAKQDAALRGHGNGRDALTFTAQELAGLLQASTSRPDLHGHGAPSVTLGHGPSPA